MFGCSLSECWVTNCFWCHYFLQNASLQTESSLLKEQFKKQENQNTSLNNQMLALQRHTTTLQEQNSSLHTQTAKLQVYSLYHSDTLFCQNGLIGGKPHPDDVKKKKKINIKF